MLADLVYGHAQSLYEAIKLVRVVAIFVNKHQAIFGWANMGNEIEAMEDLAERLMKASASLRELENAS